MKKIVAVTACTTGIAHTYMAAKSLSKAAADMDVEIYVEKQGAAGVEDELTSEQIKEADVVIFAIEKGIDESRFAGKKIYKTKPGKAIKAASTGNIKANALPPPIWNKAHGREPSFSNAVIPNANDNAIKIPPVTTIGIMYDIPASICVYAPENPVFFFEAVFPVFTAELLFNDSPI